MGDDIPALKQRLVKLLDQSRQRLLDTAEGIPFDQGIHEKWTLRDILGHIAVWEVEVVRSLEAYHDGHDYTIASLVFDDFTSTDRYNESAAEERGGWSEDQIREELDSAREAFKRMIRELLDERYPGNMMFPWGARGSIEQLVVEMTIHEEEHTAEIRHAH